MNQLFAFSQNDAVNRFVYPPRDIEHNDCVKSVTIFNYSFNKKNDVIDTIKTINKVQFIKKGSIEKQWYYDSSSKDPWQIIEYDNKERILTISRKNKDQISLFAKQFFNSFSEYPDSLNIYRREKKKTDQYINIFKKKLLVKQEYYTQDTLRHYNTFQYDKKKRLIKESFINTKNGWGITIDKSITGNKDEKTLNSNDYKTYDYSTFKDTMVITKTNFTPKHTYKEIKKELKSNSYLLKINEEYNNNYLEKSTYTYTSRDSIFNCTYYYINKKQINRFYKTVTTPNKIISNWNNNDKESKEVIRIEIELDEFNNWIRKTYTTNNTVTRLTTRKIEYYCH